MSRGGAHKSTGPLCAVNELKIRQVKDPTCSPGCSVSKLQCQQNKCSSNSNRTWWSQKTNDLKIRVNSFPFHIGGGGEASNNNGKGICRQCSVKTLSMALTTNNIMI